MTSTRKLLDPLLTLGAGMLFGFWAGVFDHDSPGISPFAFLTLNDLGLLLVFGSAVGSTFVVFSLAATLATYALLSWRQLSDTSFTLDRSSLLGGVVFGLGWGICGGLPGACAGFGSARQPRFTGRADQHFAGAGLHGLWANRKTN